MSRRSPSLPPARALVAVAATIAALTLLACGDDEGEAPPVSGDDVVSTALDPSDQTTIPDLPVNDDISAVTCTGEPAGVVDATELVGLSLADAEAAAAEQGCSVREVERDGEGLAATQDFRPDRINVATEDGTVAEIVDLG